MEKVKELLNILNEKFGSTICNKLINKDLSLDFSKIVKKGNGKTEVHKQFLTLVSKGLLDIEYYNYYKDNWAFDFPGWIGKLSQKNNRIRDYMIIQAEPHVENFDYQIVYEFAEKNYKQDFSIWNNKIKSNTIRDIWTRTIKFIATETEYQAIFIDKELDVLYSLLENIYITDICHFAPQIQVNQLLSQNKWTKDGGVRDEIAKEYLMKEIFSINPKLIISSGTTSNKAVRKYLMPYFECKEILNPDDVKGRRISSIPLVYELYKENEVRTYLAMVPHLGFDGFPPGTFWKEKGRELHSKLREKIIKDWL
jgi:hypothetical protein